MGAPLLGKHFAGLHSASTPAITLAAAGSFLGQVAAVAQGAPVWVYVVVALAPWVPVLVLELIWTYRHYRWMAVFCLLVVTQSVYLLEQVARTVQIHVLGREPLDAPGIFGTLGIEPVELAWTSWAVVGMLLLVSRFPRNPWLWLTLVISIWDAVGGMIVAEGPLAQANVHLADSLLEIAALNLAFALQLGRTYDAWLARAFPELPEQVLIDATGRLQEVRLRQGERVTRGEARLYIVTRGRGLLLRDGPGGHDILLRVLGPGQIVRNEGTQMVAETTLELLALPVRAA
jgi:hypothetical protein